MAQYVAQMNTKDLREEKKNPTNEYSNALDGNLRGILASLVCAQKVKWQIR